MDRSLIAVAGIAGAIGVALAAAGAHLPDGGRLAIAGSMAMAQAPALLALGFYWPSNGRLLGLSAWVIALGLLGFAGALIFHSLSGSAALSFIAPIGGTTMIIGWIGVTVAALVTKR
ncbi:DUF423 domain-containing protein [Kaistia dalseonensis]|uniref:Uncharacterized membrane protein YgdD (TMEM256/DUF423 family) n=1 Tax=Kaistia dalseonensis TaxID=410840 RepID=A0ABU0H8L5_9HYPH|nr:DUF423 domain-containing protein [Kaistia dalseonensis]MCX5495263.1 DUF423 domain-containing protein [Kaistia dalseonensis]MDQ0437849.1 uncharacterized membrane protein YgdD (TMEM256/DUF423 family) [Kaistia dalseonensis]